MLFINQIIQNKTYIHKNNSLQRLSQQLWSNINLQRLSALHYSFKLQQHLFCLSTFYFSSMSTSSVILALYLQLIQGFYGMYLIVCLKYRNFKLILNVFHYKFATRI